MSTKTDAGSHLTETLEDYLEIILMLSLEMPTVRVRDIARVKGVRMPTVTWALRRLAEKQLVLYAAREYVELTEPGGEIARSVAGRHRFLSAFLVKILGVAPKVAEKDACGLEHHLSPQTLDRLAALVEYVETCPEVQKDFLTRFQQCFTQPKSSSAACQRSGCRTDRARRGEDPDLVSLGTLPAGAQGSVARVHVSVKRRPKLIRSGLLPGTVVEKLSPPSLRRPALIRLDGQDLKLTAAEARSILVARIPDGEEETGVGE